MKQKKVLAGVIATVLALGTGAAAYAAEPQGFDWAAVQVQGKISTVREGALSFDETALPEGVQFAQAISVDGEEDNRIWSIFVDDVEGALPVDETALPKGVQFAQEVSEGGVEGTNLVPGGAIGDVEGALPVDETALPGGVQYTAEGSNSIANGAMGLE